MRGDLCSNCQSQRHRACCPRCGAIVRRASRGGDFCTLRCARDQAEADRRSDNDERDYQEQNKP